MQSFIYLFPIFSLIFFSCSEHQDDQSAAIAWQEITGRDSGSPTKRTPIYRVKVPLSWSRQNPSPLESLEDTTKALCKFKITDTDQNITIAIHNFPSENLNARIPPSAQIARWKQQFESLEPCSAVLNPQAYGGFSGIFFEGTGMLDGKRTTIFGWAMQLAPEHYQNLLSQTQNEDLHAKQQQADYTIKAVGPEKLMSKHKQTIFAFANSFELIEELP